MTFEKWNDKHWKIIKMGEDEYGFNAPGTRYIFNKHDLLQLYQNIGAVADHLYEKDVYYIHDNDVFNRETGEQLLGVIGDCEELNRLYKQNQQLIKDRQDFLTDLDNLERAIIKVKEDFSDNEDVQKAIELIAIRKKTTKR